MILSKNDRREIRNFERFLKLKDKFFKKMLTKPMWQKYLGLTNDEAQTILDNAKVLPLRRKEK